MKTLKTFAAAAALSFVLPLYDCHKQVMAAVITGIAPESNDGKVELFLKSAVDGSTASLEVEAAWIGKHSPELGGYFVVYEDGYTSYSPKDVFEAGYTHAPELTFQDRVKAEQAELSERIDKLKPFINESPIYKKLPEAEQIRMFKQLAVMLELQLILKERIENFA